MPNFFKSTFNRLVSEENGLPRAYKGIPMEDFMEKVVKPRAEFAKKIEASFNAGKITKEQFNKLINLNRQNSLNQ